MKMNLLACLITLAPIMGICQNSGVDGTELIDNTKEKPAPTFSEEETDMLRAEVSCIGQHLDAFYKDCGRYPTTQEGLRALISKPKTIRCTKWGLKTEKGSKPYVASLPNGGVEWEYTSTDGVFYKLKPLVPGSKIDGRNGGLSAEDFLKTCSGYKILAPEQKAPSKPEVAKARADEIAFHLGMFFVDCDEYPETLLELVTKPKNCKNWGPDPYEKRLPEDPWGRPFVYKRLDTKHFLLKSLGADGKEGGAGDNVDIVVKGSAPQLKKRK